MNTIYKNKYYKYKLKYQLYCKYGGGEHGEYSKHGEDRLNEEDRDDGEDRLDEEDREDEEDGEDEKFRKHQLKTHSLLETAKQIEKNIPHSYHYTNPLQKYRYNSFMSNLTESPNYDQEYNPSQYMHDENNKLRFLLERAKKIN